jgi:hypothetical protein
MNSITNGTISYRTKCLTIDAAGRFAKCLGANARFTDITIENSLRAKGPRAWFVRFAPSNPDRVQDLLDRAQTARARRACEQEFTFCLDKDAGRPFFWCWSHSSGEVYETTEHSCNCPDAEFRLKGTGLRCKHQLALLNAEPAAIQSW